MSSSRPVRMAVAQRLPTQTLAGMENRRTSNEVKQDKEKATQLEAANAEANAKSQTDKQKKVAQAEDVIRREDIQRTKTAARPDLAMKTSKAPKLRDNPITTSRPTANPGETHAEVTTGAEYNGQSETAPRKRQKRVLPEDWTIPSAGKLDDQDKPVNDHTCAEPSPSWDEYSVGSGDDEYCPSPVQALGGGEVLPEVIARESQRVRRGDTSETESPYHGEETDDEMETQIINTVAAEVKHDRVKNAHYQSNIYAKPTLAKQGSSNKENNDCEEPNSDSSEGFVPFKVVKKPKPQRKLRGEFRQAVNTQRTAPPISAAGTLPGKKRKSTELAPLQNESLPKRAKQPEHAGLLDGWKTKMVQDQKQVIAARNIANAAAHQRAKQGNGYDEDEDEHDPQEYAGGVFDTDETMETTYIVGQGRKSMQHGLKDNKIISVKITTPAIVEPVIRGRRPKKVKYSTNCLPFPPKNALIYFQTWRRTYKPSIIEYAGNLSDPFGTNAVVEGPAIELWNKIYPNMSEAVEEGSEGRAALVQVSSDLLIGWRSTMGKEGISIVNQTLLAEGVRSDQAAEVASYLLRDLRFVYDHPDEMEDKGAFRSTLVAKAFARCLKHVKRSVRLGNVDYSRPAGALGVATAVIERGLDLLKTGKIRLDGAPTGFADSNGKKKLADYHQYADAHWGAKTRGWTASASRLSAAKWDLIRQAALAQMDPDDVNDGEEEGMDAGDVDPRAFIEI